MKRRSATTLSCCFCTAGFSSNVLPARPFVPHPLNHDAVPACRSSRGQVAACLRVTESARPHKIFIGSVQRHYSQHQYCISSSNAFLFSRRSARGARLEPALVCGSVGVHPAGQTGGRFSPRAHLKVTGGRRDA